MSNEKAYECILEELHRLKKSNDTLVKVIENQSVVIVRQEALIKTLLEVIQGLAKNEIVGTSSI
jgi:hypothetical protein